MFAPNGLNNLLSPMVSEKITHLLTILGFSRCQDFDPLPCESTFGRLDKQFGGCQTWSCDSNSFWDFVGNVFRLQTRCGNVAECNSMDMCLKTFCSFCFAWNFRSQNFQY